MSSSSSGKRLKRFRSRRHRISNATTSAPDQQWSDSTLRKDPFTNCKPKLLEEDGICRSQELNELIFLRDLHFGFLPDDCEVEFSDCFQRFIEDENFALKCLRLALLSRNEELVRALLDQLKVTKINFQYVNDSFVEALLLEAVELDDFESIEGILAWRQVKAKEIGLTEVDRRCLRLQVKAQQVIITAAIRNSYPIVKILISDGYKIVDKIVDDRFFFYISTESSGNMDDDIMERHIERIRLFKAQASPAYMSLTYINDPISHAFDYTKKAKIGMQKEPEFKKDFEETQQKCRGFAVSILDVCRNSSEVEMVLDDTGKKSRCSRLYRALFEEEKEFVAHSYCQLLLKTRWMRGLCWSSKSLWRKMSYILSLLLSAPFLCLLYSMSPKREHKDTKGMLGVALRQLDRPFNRFILDTYFYCIFLGLVLYSVLMGIDAIQPSNDEKKDLRKTSNEVSWSLAIVSFWVACYIVRDIRNIILLVFGELHALSRFRFAYDIVLHLLFSVAIAFKVYGFKFAYIPTGGFISVGSAGQNSLDQTHPINIGANLYGIAACLAFLRMIFIFEIHHRFGPILFCIKNVFWDILSVMGSYVITMLAFSVGLVSIFGTYKDEETRFSNFESTFKRLFWIIFDPGQEELTDIGPEEDVKCCSRNVTKATSPSFIRPLLRPGMPSAAAPIDSEDSTSISHNIGIYIWGAYQVFVVLIMLNLLISLMTTTFSRIQSNADMEWKFTRASTWIHYYDDRHSIPVPFNVIPSLWSIRIFISCIRVLCCQLKNNDQTDGLSTKNSWISFQLMEHQSRRKQYDGLIERVFRSEEKQQDMSVTKMDLEAIEKEISIDIAELRRDLRGLRRDLLARLGNGNMSDSIMTASELETQMSKEAASGPKKEEDNKKLETEAEAAGGSCEQKGQLERRRAFTIASYKDDNQPEAVEHLVKTLGLVSSTVPVSPNSLRREIRMKDDEEKAKRPWRRSFKY